jgi:two-component system phosphate regulon sensor histidine kinase PhoR
MDVLRHSQLNDLLRHVTADGQPRIEEVRTFDPVERLFEAHAVPLNVDDVQQGALLVLHDITRLRQLEQMRRDFVANVSHELRTPLAAIRGFAETLKLGAVDDKAHREEFLSGIENHTEQMTRLIDDLLDLAAIESGKHAPQRTAFKMSVLARDVRSNLLPLAERKRVRIDIISAAEDPDVSADRIQIKQVLTNLIDNAIKFNKDGGSIEIKLDTEESFLKTSVTDTGVGIPAQALPRVFERFFRVDKARSRDLGGTGLGLAIVKHIIEATVVP